MTFRPELIDELLKDYRNPEDLMGESGIFKQLSKALIERCLRRLIRILCKRSKIPVTKETAL